ncbi:MAG: hypothetical protein AB8B96_03550 [Lysobacterales bacterium]
MIRTFTHRILGILLLTVLAAHSVRAQTSANADTPLPSPDPPASAPPPGLTLAQMSADADAIAVVRVSLTEYQKTRNFPSSGFAMLEVLVPYRGVKKGQTLQVTERGLGDTRCYYPELGTWQFEGDRFLAFLKRGDNDTWRGRAPGCRLPVLVDASHQFVLRHPIKGLEIEDSAVIQTVDYADPAARVDASDFTRAKINELENYYRASRVISTDPLAPPDLVYEYSQGITLSNVRRLMTSPDSK